MSSASLGQLRHTYLRVVNSTVKVSSAVPGSYPVSYPPVIRDGKIPPSFSCMVCAECRVFTTTPVCGACRAVSRILGLLRSGHLKPEQERRVTEVLRGAAGELTDLVEGNHPKGKAPDTPVTPEETPDRTSRSDKTPEVKKEGAADSDSTEESGEEEEEERDATAEAASRPEADSGTPAADGSGGDAPEGPKEREDSPGKIYPEGEARALNLQPVPKAETRDRRRQAKPRSSRRDGDRDRRGEEAQSGRDERHDDEEDSLGRAPLERRPRAPDRPADRGTKGTRKARRRGGQPWTCTLGKETPGPR
eukprot:s21_g5.t1